jgi:hypothetical protein
VRTMGNDVGQQVPEQRHLDTGTRLRSPIGGGRSGIPTTMDTQQEVSCLAQTSEGS